MAKESSFDVVSQIDMQEVDNAFQQAKKELSQRYDLKDSGATVALDKQAKKITIKAPKVDLAAIKWGDSQASAGQSVTKTADIVEGIDRDTAGKINKDIKGLKLKAKVQIEGDHLRVSSASRDTLQEVIAFLKDQDYGQPLQYINYR